MLEMPARRTVAENKLPKQTDVARLAGVSTATVSHVLSGQSDRVSEPTRQRVLDAIRQLGYKAPPADLRTSSMRTQTIGLLVPDLSEEPISRDYFFREMLDSVLSTCLLKGWGVTIMAERMWADTGQAIRREYDGKCDGVLVLSPQDDELVTPLVERGVPVVQIATVARVEGVSSVSINDRKIGVQAADALAAAGHRIVGFGGKTQNAGSADRLAGFKLRMEEHGGQVLAFEFESWEPRREIRAALDAWRQERCTGVFTWSDDTACFLYKALAERGLVVPKDMSVIGAHDGRARILRPKLATFRLPLSTLGTRAAEMLIERIETGDLKSERLLFDAEYIPRRSIAPPQTA
jgi:DNA-binding LacI/PurR family transcriptional regulator